MSKSIIHQSNERVSTTIKRADKLQMDQFWQNAEDEADKIKAQHEIDLASYDLSLLNEKAEREAEAQAAIQAEIENESIFKWESDYEKALQDKFFSLGDLQNLLRSIRDRVREAGSKDIVDDLNRAIVIASRVYIDPKIARKTLFPKEVLEGWFVELRGSPKAKSGVRANSFEPNMTTGEMKELEKEYNLYIYLNKYFDSQRVSIYCGVYWKIRERLEKGETISWQEYIDKAKANATNKIIRMNQLEKDKKK